MYSTFSHIQKFYQTTVSSQAPATLLLKKKKKPKTFLRISLFSWSAGVWHLRCTIFPKLLSTCQSTKPTIKHVAAEAISFLFFKSYRMDPATPSQQKHGSAYANGVLFCFLQKMHWVRQNGLRYPPFRYHHIFYPHCRHTPFSQTAAYSNIHPIKKHISVDAFSIYPSFYLCASESVPILPQLSDSYDFLCHCPSGSSVTLFPVPFFLFQQQISRVPRKKQRQGQCRQPKQKPDTAKQTNHMRPTI